MGYDFDYVPMEKRDTDQSNALLIKTSINKDFSVKS